MDANVFRRVLDGIGANAFNQVVTVVVQLVGVPVLLLAWGAQLYGEWLILFAIPAYLAMTDLGFSQSAGNDMAAKKGRQDESGALAVFQSLIALVYPVSVAGFLFAAIIVWQLPIASLFDFEIMDQRSAQLVLWLLATEVLLQVVNASTHAGFKAGGDYALHVLLNAFTRLFQFSALWFIAFGGGGPFEAATGFVFVRLIGTLLSLGILFRRQAWLRFGFAGARWAELKSLLPPALANMAIPTAQALNLQGMIIVVGSLLGAQAVVVFATLRTLTRVALQIVRAISGAAEPEMARAHGARDSTLLRSLFLHALRAGLWIALMCAVFLVIFGERLLQYWTSGTVEMNFTLFYWLAASAVISTLWYTPLFLLRAANRHLRSAVVSVIGAGLAILLASFWLGSSERVADAGASLVITELLVATYTLVAGCALVGVKWPALLQVLNPLPLLKFLASRWWGLSIR